MSTVSNNILKINSTNTSNLNVSKALHPSIQELQSHLLNLWTSCSVDQTYQNLFIVFIESFVNPKEQAREIEAEIKKTYQQNSLFFLLQQNLVLRYEIKSQIQDQITKQTQSGSIKKADKIDIVLRELCDKLKNLRRINLLISENILKIFEDFKITRQNSIGSLGRNYIDIFMKIDVQNQFIKESFLNQYILFQKGYDPFFLVHYEETKKSQNLFNLKKHLPVSELFEMNISYVYRLMRAQQKMLKYMLFIDDHTGTEKERRQLINRQRLLKIANSNNHIVPEEREEDVRLPLIKNNFGDRNRLQENVSVASTIKQFVPFLQRKPNILRDGDDIKRNHSDLSQGVMKKKYSLKPIDTEEIRHSLNSNSPKQYSLNKGGQRYGNPIDPLSSPQHQGKLPTLNQKNYDTQDEIQNNLISQRSGQQMMASRQQSQNSATNSQKKWNIKKVLKDRMHNLRPVKSQEYNKDVIDEEQEQQNQFMQRNRIQFQNDYPVYISLKKSKLADSEVEEISKNRYRIKTDKSRQSKKYKQREKGRQTQMSKEKYKKKQKQSKRNKKNKQRSSSSDEDSRRNSKSKRKKEKFKNKRKRITSQSEEEVKKTSKKTKNNKKKISSSQSQSQKSLSNSEKNSISSGSVSSQSKSSSQQSLKHKKKHKQKKQSQKKKNKNKAKKDQSPSEQEPPKKKNLAPIKQKPKQAQKSIKQAQASKKQPPKKKSSKPKQTESQTQQQQESPVNKNKKPRQKQVSEKQPQLQKKQKVQEKPAKVPSKPQKVEPSPKLVKQQKQAQLQKEELPTKKQPPKKEPLKSQPVTKKQEPPKKEEQQKKLQPNKKEEPPKKVEPPKQASAKKEQSEGQSQSQQSQQSQEAPQIKPKASNPAQINATSKIKMIPGKISYSQFQAYIKSKRSHQAYLQKVQESIKFVFSSAKNTQTYLNEFHLNDQLAAVALCSPTASGNMVIYLWMPIDKTCDEKSSQFCFKKYLDYLEQQTTYKEIIFSGPEIPELKGEGFVMQKEKNYLRKRVKPITREQFQLEYFFSMEASNICFIQNSPESLFFSDEISPLSEHNSWCNPGLLNGKEQYIDQELDDTWEAQEKIKSLKQANALLQKDEYDTFEIGQQKVIFKDINMTRSKLSRVPKFGFICNDGFMIVAGKSIIFSDAKRKIDKFEMMNDLSLYFASGFKNVQQMVSFLIKIKDKVKQQDCKLAFKMFSKQMYGRYIVKDPQLEKDKAFYCNWDLNFGWRDQIPGKIVHDMTGVKNKYGPQSFVCAVEFKGILTMGVEIEKEDFLY